MPHSRISVVSAYCMYYVLRYDCSQALMSWKHVGRNDQTFSKVTRITLLLSHVVFCLLVAQSVDFSISMCPFACLTKTEWKPHPTGTDQYCAGPTLKNTHMLPSSLIQSMWNTSIFNTNLPFHSCKHLVIWRYSEMILSVKESKPEYSTLQEQPINVCAESQQRM